MPLGRFFGGPKPPRPPKELRQIGGKVMGYMDKFEGLGDRVIGIAEGYAPQLERLYGDLGSELGQARDQIRDIGQQSLRTYQDLYQPLERQTAMEIGAAGGAEYQARARDMAGSNALMQAQGALNQRRDMAGVRGMTGTGYDMSQDPFVQGQLALRASAAGNQAAWNERLRGEGVRRQFLPQVHNYYGQAVNRAVTQPAQLAAQEGQALSAASGALAGLIQPGIGLYKTGVASAKTAGDLFQTDYNNQVQYQQQRAMRQQAIIKGITQVAGAAITGGMSGGVGGAIGGIAEGLSGGAISGSGVQNWYEQNWGTGPDLAGTSDYYGGLGGYNPQGWGGGGMSGFVDPRIGLERDMQRYSDMPQHIQDAIYEHRMNNIRNLEARGVMF